MTKHLLDSGADPDIGGESPNGLRNMILHNETSALCGQSGGTPRDDGRYRESATQKADYP